MGRHFLAALPLALLGVGAIEVRIASHDVNSDSDVAQALQGVRVFEAIVSEAVADSMETVNSALFAGARLQAVLEAQEAGTLEQLIQVLPLPDTAVALSSKTEDDPPKGLDVLMKVGQAIMGGLKDKVTETGDKIGQVIAAGKGEDLLKGLGAVMSQSKIYNELMPKRISDSDLKKIKEFESKFTVGAKSNKDEFEKKILKKAKSSTEFGPSADQAAKSAAASAEILKKLGRVVGLAQPALVKKMQAAVDREPTDKMILRLTNLKKFLDLIAPNDPRAAPLRDGLATPEAIKRMARFAEAIKEVQDGYTTYGEMWCLSDEGFAATARVVVATMAMDGKPHEPFNCEQAVAIHKYMKDHPEETVASIKVLHERFDGNKKNVVAPAAAPVPAQPAVAVK